MSLLFKSIFSLLLVWISSFFSTGYIYSADQLSVSTVRVTDDKHIRITFSEPIDAESIVLKIAKQSDNSTIKTDAISSVVDAPESIDVTLDDTLMEASSYTLTVIAGIGKSGATITDGAAALQDFITPSPLKVFAPETEFNAPANPNAVMTQTGSSTNNVSPSTVNNRVDPVEPAPAEELPLTGPSSLILIGLALVLAYMLIWRKKNI
jgi:LPXTG-motif cell wall-anchored protein